MNAICTDMSNASAELPVGNAYITIHCHNITRYLNDYLASLASNVSNNSGIQNEEEKSDPNSPENQKNAVIYIVVVLFFYSFGIGIMMIKYMRKEAKEQQECKMYRQYINAAHEQYLHSTNRARLANRLALQALNTVNAIPQTTQLGSKVTFV
ncbi:uncharacterized protein LOC111614378 [Centruroides sculpturatus]|uniref:uncharacterized protein LOC111614378 n=1 Tax=Centruroides sculpturatus TaxID=218467 RepID=UPI000C6EF071|nr:uncharacterized protein LOC111614378 [Centruroides sculpturatus]XP_023211519.1 uncharacterized protein LOC111614378 [Centruroides sculpturatus]